jgi:membrane fusion protein (multidrug efflux system)
MRLRIFSLLFLLGASFAAGITLAYTVPKDFWLAQWARYQPTSQPAAGPTTASAIAVRSVVVEAGPVVRRLTSIGSLAAHQSIVIQPEIAGKVLKIGFTEGGRVDKGQVLIELDAEVSAAERARAQAQLELAQSEFKRSNQLAEQGVTTARARDEAAAQLAIAKAEAELAEARLAKSTIVAPFDGIVGLSDVAKGKFLAAGDVIVNLEQIDPLKVDFRVPESFVSAVGVGQSIEIVVDAFPDRKFSGTVYAIDPLVDVNGRAVKIRAQVSNADGVLKPGLFVRVTLVLNVRADALLLPESALVPEGGDIVVYRLDDDTAHRIAVRIGQRQEGKVEIVEGLKPGDRVVAEGQINLFDGAKVVETP